MEFLWKGSLRLLKIVKRPLVFLAILHVFLILIYDNFGLTSKKIKGFSEVSSIGKIQEIKKYSTEDGEVYHLTVKGEERPFQKILLKINGRGLKKSLFHLHGKEEIEIGDRIKYRGKVEAFEKAKNPGGFDRERYYTNEGYFGMMKVGRIQVLKQTAFHKLLYFIPNQLFKIRNQMKERYQKILGETVAGTLSAMVLGDKTELDAEVKELYSDNAISHLLAISGLHISLVGMLLYQFLKKINLSFQISHLFPMFFLVLYGSFTGFSVSTTRAVLMMLLFFFSYLIGRSYDLPTALSFSSLFILFGNHRLLYQASFQLSFLAVIGIFYAVKQTELIFLDEGEKNTRIGRYKNFIKASILSTITLNFVLLPVLLWHYFEISLNGILLNIVVIPLMSIIVITGLFGGILGFLSIVLSTFLLGSTNYLLEFYTFLCRVANENPWNKVILGRPSMLQILIYYVVLGGLIGILERERRREKILMLRGGLKEEGVKRKQKKKKQFLIFLLPVLFWLLTIRKPESRLYCLDVGRGHCEVVGSGKRGCYLIHCGSVSEKNIGKTILLPFLKYKGWRRIRGIILADMGEEYSSGILEILDNKEIKIEKVMILSTYRREDGKKRKEILEKIKKRGIKFLSFKEKERWREGNLEFQCLSEKKISVIYPNKE